MLSASALSSTLYFSGRPIIDITPMMGGLSHRLYLVTYHANGTATQCVVRCINDELLATQEYALMGHASVLSASIKALERMSIDGQLVSLIIMEFIQGDLAKDVCLNDEHLTIIAEQLTSLHQSLPSSPVKRPSVNKLSLIDDYWQLVANASAQDISRYQHCYELLRHLSFENTSLIHGDLNLSNLIVNTHNNGVVWLDWEYASVGDAYFDYAAFIVECDQEIEGPFIEYIQSQLDDVVDRDKLVYFKLYYVLVSWLWCMGLAESKTPQLIAALNKYRDEVDQLVAVIAASDISL